MQTQIATAAPTGWFQIGWSQEVAPGEVYPIRYFGRDLVCYRGVSGVIRLFDAFCPHRGAHLGHGGVVTGDDIECPFHGWRWSADGRNSYIPDSNRRCEDRALKCWPVREFGDVILAWHDTDGKGPYWEPPTVAESFDPAYYPAFPHAVRKERVRFPPQYPLENLADLAHVKYVHRWPDVPGLAGGGENGVTFTVAFEGLMSASGGEVAVKVESEAWGVGLLYSSFVGLHDSTQLVATTPIDDEWSEMFHSVWVRRMEGDTGDAPRGLALALIRAQFEESFGATADRPIFENQRYVERPPYVREEGRLFAQLRRWSRQFYPNDHYEPRSSVDGQRTPIASASGGTS